jgi:hypothetical protein
LYPGKLTEDRTLPDLTTKIKGICRCLWLSPIILGRQRSECSWFESSLGKEFTRPHLKKILIPPKKEDGLAEWL